MNLSLQSLQALAQKGYITPAFDLPAMREQTRKAPRWIHFGAGNIFRAFPAVLVQRLLEMGAMDSGLCVAECYDEEIIDRGFAPFDNLCVAVSLKHDGSVDKRVVASIAEALAYTRDYDRLREIMTAQSLQIVSMTITEKGYAVRDAETETIENPITIIAKLCRLLYARFQAGAYPVAMVSLDNCSHNGDLLQAGILAVAESWLRRGAVTKEFLNYLRDPARVYFTWSMIDKITPRPAQAVLDMLKADGLEGMEVTETAKHTFISAMVNAEECEYLAIEDCFPNGRPKLEQVGVIFGTRETVDKIEKMKVCTCLNPLHTCLAIFGCLLGHTKISEEMCDETLTKMIRVIGYTEGMPVVADPGIMSAEKFIDEVLTKRFPNPFVPDTPQRIACDTSKKLPVRFGETLKAYVARGKDDLSFLTMIPMVFAGYARYLTGIGDDGKPFALSPDPNLPQLQKLVQGYELGKPFDTGKLRPLFENPEICGVNLYDHNLGQKVETYFAAMNTGVGAIRKIIDANLR
ncbi:MAG TPA: mannitol dehydrogenase family protein [Candidatus Limiplasma sp.]|nr:mannitol dehydrogenase family protein [Candidatus Limiplasma sp.]